MFYGLSYNVFSATHAGSMHDSTASQSSSRHKLLMTTRSWLPPWATVAADNAFQNKMHAITPYSGQGLTQKENAFNFYLSSCRTTLEQAFGMIVGRFGILWSPLRHDLKKSSLIIVVCCRLHSFIIDQNGFESYDMEASEDSRGSALAHL